jgi:hypothetical protein
MGERASSLQSNALLLGRWMRLKSLAVLDGSRKAGPPEE